MNFDFLDKNVSLTTNVFLIVANIINLWYNIPQVIKTYKCKSTRDFSSWFLFLRVIGNTIWIGYAIEIDSFQMLLNNIVTVLASSFICYYKIKEIINDYKHKKNDNNIDMNNLSIEVDEDDKKKLIDKNIIIENITEIN